MITPLPRTTMISENMEKPANAASVTLNPAYRHTADTLSEANVGIRITHASSTVTGTAMSAYSTARGTIIFLSGSSPSALILLRP